MVSGQAETSVAVELDPQSREMLDRLYANPFLDPVNMTPPQMRAAFDSFYAEVGLPPEPVDTWDVSLPAEGRPVGLRIYRPQGASGPLPMVMFYLGGGFVMGSLDSYDGICRRLCRSSGCIVVSVAYRQPPEHPFPAAAEDSYAALLWAHEHASDYGGDADRLAVCGESGGGLLATLVAHMAQDRGGPELKAQVLMYPAIGRSESSQSMKDFARGYWFEPEQLDWLYQIYARDMDYKDPRISPLFRPDLSGSPQTSISVAEYDILRDDVLAYAKRHQDAGVAVRLRRYPSIHGFVCMGGVIDMAATAIDDAASDLAEALKP